MATQDVSAGHGSPATPGNGRRGSIGLVLLVAVLLVGAAAFLMLLGGGRAQPYVFGLLTVLATVGVFSLFATAAGILRIGGREGDDALLHSLIDEALDGVVVTDPGGRVLYANSAYLRLVDAAEIKDVRPLERLFIGYPDVSEAI